MQKMLSENKVPSISSFSLLLSNPFDEQNWRRIFSEQDLRTRVCVVVIKEEFHFFGSLENYTKTYKTEYLAFTRPWWYK